MDRMTLEAYENDVKFFQKKAIEYEAQDLVTMATYYYGRADQARGWAEKTRNALRNSD